jgi:hypothetical protein
MDGLKAYHPLNFHIPGSSCQAARAFFSKLSCGFWLAFVLGCRWADVRMDQLESQEFPLMLALENLRGTPLGYKRETKDQHFCPLKPNCPLSSSL